MKEVIFCETRKEARECQQGLHLEIGETQPLTLACRDNKNRPIVKIGNIADAGVGGVLFGSREYVKGGCRWGVVVEVSDGCR